MLKQILFGGESGLSPLANAGLALLRIFAGIAMMGAHGLGKIPPSEKFIAGTAEMGFPAPVLFSWLAGFSEALGGLFLALGFLTRISSFLIVCVMLTALIGRHLNDPFGSQEKAFLYLFIALAFMLKGASDWSIDGFIRQSGRV